MSNTSINDKDNSFTIFEKQAWERSATFYHQLFGPFTCQIADILLEAVKANQHPASLLDLATGPGYLANMAPQYGYAKVTGIDFSNEMISIAKLNQVSSHSRESITKTVKFKVEDAEQLEETDNSFDSVTMNFGLLHLPNPDKAIGEAYRVLKSGGKFAYTVWAKPEQNPGFKLLLEAVDTFVDKTITIPEGPAFFYFSDKDNSINALTNAGFIDISIQSINLEWVVESSDDFFNAFLKGGARIGGLLRLQSETTVNSIRNKVMADSKPYKNGDKLHIPICVMLVVGTKPS
jgi:ubiquinone/menaquinone biosynthesis C-methylase UbiE